MAMAAVMKKYGISPDDMGDHSTATSVYMHMLMARVHGQNPRTYAEIQASNREGSDLLRGLIEELRKVRELGDKGDVQALKEYIEENREHLQDGGQLTGWLEASKHVDELLSR
jgi:prephenate dehydrogenase